MRSSKKTIGAVLLGCLISVCAALNGPPMHAAQTNPSAQSAEAVSPDDSAPSTTEQGEVTTRRVVPGDPCLSSPDINCQQRLNQLRELQAQKFNPPMGLMAPARPQIPPVPANGGLCVMDITGQASSSSTNQGTTTLANATYRHTEIHLWQITSSSPTAGPVAGEKRYAMTWSMVGNGDLSSSVTSTTVGGQSHSNQNLRVWNITPTTEPAQLSLWRNSANQWLIKLVPAPLSAPITESQQQTIDGVIQTNNVPPTTGQRSAFTDNFFNWTESSFPSQLMMRTQHVPVRPGMGYAQINPALGTGGVAGGVDCVWNLTLTP